MEPHITQAYNGDALQVMENNPINSSPRGRHQLWMDNIVMLKSSKNKELAYKFIDFLLNAEIVTQYEYCRYATPNKAANNLLPDTIKNTHLLSKEYLQKCYMINALAKMKKIDKLF